MLRCALLSVLVVFVTPCGALAADAPWVARSHVGMVASDSPEASRIGADVLAAGGNAFDAAVATSLALAVARPHSTGLGGGGFMLAYVAKEKRAVVLDFREMAPAAATAAYYANLHGAKGAGPSPTVYGGNAVGVPGQVAGLAEIRKRYGTWSWANLVKPAYELCLRGFVADENYRGACKSALANIQKWPELKGGGGALYNTLLGHGEPPKVGEKVHRPNLAQALRLLVSDGPEVFYRGPVATAIAQTVQRAGGPLRMSDLAAYRVRERQPIRGSYHGFEILGMPPPSSGGVCLIETLNVLNAYASLADVDLNAPTSRALYLVWSMKHAFADRARWLGDADFAPVPVDYLTSRAYAQKLARKRPVLDNDWGTVQLPDDHGTSHFCVADAAGNVVAITETINGTFGSLLVAEPFGIILNNQMDDFAANPGKPNLYGLIQGKANAIAPGKRPLSSMSPTIVLKEGKPVLALGGSGGPRIITSVLQVLLNVVRFEMPLEQAVAAVRLHHQWLPDEVYFDREPPKDVKKALEAAGQDISAKRSTGIVQAIHITADGMMIGASDPRKGGRPVGVKASEPVPSAQSGP